MIGAAPIGSVWSLMRVPEISCTRSDDWKFEIPDSGDSGFEIPEIKFGILRIRNLESGISVVSYGY